MEDEKDLKDLIEERGFVSNTDTKFIRVFNAFKIKVVNSLSHKRLEELKSLTESDQDIALEIMTEKVMTYQKVVPPSYRFMVWCEACGCERPLPVQEKKVLECCWCQVFKSRKAKKK